MKTCPVCELDLEDSYLFCPDDGSTLNFLPRHSTVGGSAISDDETAGAVVLYCPACAAEYPLTFTSCPVHGMKLTRHPIPRSVKPVENLPEPAAVLPHEQDQSTLPEQLTTIETEPQHLEQQPLADSDGSDELDNEAAYTLGGYANDLTETDAAVGSGYSVDYQSSAFHSQEDKLERPGFRVAAIATVIALTLFGLVAAYSLVSNLSRRSTASTKTAAAADSAAQPLPFVATPQEALDYKEEPEDPAPPTAPEQSSEPSVDRVRRDSVQSSPPELAVRKSPVVEPLRKIPEAPPVQATRVSNPPMPPLPRGNAGGFDARLIRLRSRKTTAGFRYDLTFNMQEQAGRAAHWQRVLISTRSINGASHSQAIPFSHRLGATGALTFTISVELTGRSEADWQGRVVCTALGWDNKGAPLQASFGANVTP